MSAVSVTQRFRAPLSTGCFVFGSTSASLLRGKDYDREICERVGELTGAEPVSVVESVTQALLDARATRVVVVTPYTDDVNRRIKTGLESDGIAVSAMYGMGLAAADAATVTPESIYSFVQSRVGTRVQGDVLFIASTDYHAMSALSLLKIAYDVPIVTTNLAALQAVKRKLHRLREREMAPAARRPATSAPSADRESSPDSPGSTSTTSPGAWWASSRPGTTRSRWR